MSVLRACAVVLLACLMLDSPPIVAADNDQLVLIETESFDEAGGWVVDQQFMDQMGSPYLLAHGLGEPVADAVTEVTLPAAGSYRVWVRTRDWVAPWNAPGAPGRFEILLDNQPVDTVFGTEGAAWHWQGVGRVQLNDTVEVRLHDLAGFDGRCDAILLSADLDFVPPDDGDALRQLRSRLLGWDQEPVDAGTYDLVVVGGGFAGSCAAIAAARLDLSVALIQDRPVLGGNGSSEVRVWPEGESRVEPYPEVGRVVDELSPSASIKLHPDPKGPLAFDDRHKTQLAMAESNLDLFLQHRVNAAEHDNNHIVSVTAQHTRSGQRKRFTARWFLDSTGDGVLGALVGADYEYAAQGHMGTTNLWSIGETTANEHQIRCLCDDDDPLSINFVASKAAQPFPRCPWAVDMSQIAFPGRDGKTAFGAPGINQLGNWFWESGFNKDIIKDGEWIRDLNLRAMFGAWDTLKNIDGKYPNHRLKWAAFIGGKRESRRLMGDVVLTANDFRNKTVFDDAAFPCSWHIDIHSPHPEYFESDSGDAYFSTFTRGKEFRYQGPYWAPYRCLYSRNIDNLFMAGRDISVSQTGLGPVRVMRTGGVMGEIVAMATSICKAHDCTPRDVYQSHLHELKQRMTQGIPAHD
ncbi:FAD-dependent oxidoreductase [Crateriforma conspicua]|uniref:Soluble pyridine nucleotide transhydrogenase n=1 Tax=Crateriforma conspicua TaxID=2527996 RepID=A0A5C5Y3Y8_9PLAN|nr:FAD-dependent oxidoreductase [Crateriforma conspicua]TWT68152.1 soluble pyridine nucleotide transhydrogenase [Crateriforma conspicua]